VHAEVPARLFSFGAPPVPLQMNALVRRLKVLIVKQPTLTLRDLFD
jgi:hypothetical protein